MQARIITIERVAFAAFIGLFSCQLISNEVSNSPPTTADSEKPRPLFNSLELPAEAPAAISNSVVQIVGGCQILHLGGEIKLESTLLEPCRALPPTKGGADPPHFWVQSARRTGQIIALSALEAEASYCGSMGCSGADSRVLITIVEKSFPEIFGFGKKGDRVVVFEIPKGILLLVHQSVDAALLEDVRSTHKFMYVGAVPYDEWIAAIRELIQLPSGADMAEWPEAGVIHWTKSKSLEEVKAIVGQQYAMTMELMNGAVSEFMFAHEFAHVFNGADCGTASRDPSKVEPACDEIAIRKMYAKYRANLFIGPIYYIVHWMIAMHHLDLLVSKGIAANVNSPLMPVANLRLAGRENFRREMPGRTWLSRAKNVVLIAQDIAKAQPGDLSPVMSEADLKWLFDHLTTHVADTEKWSASLDQKP